MILIVESARPGLWSYEPSTTFLVYLYLLFSFFLLSLEIAHVFHSTMSFSPQPQENNSVEQQHGVQLNTSGATLHLTFIPAEQERSTHRDQDDGHYIQPSDEPSSLEHQTPHLENTRTYINADSRVRCNSKRIAPSERDEPIYSFNDGNHDILLNRVNVRRANTNCEPDDDCNEIQHINDDGIQAKTFLYIEELCGNSGYKCIVTNQDFINNETTATWNSLR